MSLMTLAWPSLVPKPRLREEPWWRIEARAPSGSKGEDVPRGADSWQHECHPPPPTRAQLHLVSLREGSCRPWGAGHKEGNSGIPVSMGQWEAW